MQKLIFIGAGGQAMSMADSIDHEQYELCGFIDELRSGEYLDLPIFGSKIEEIPYYRDYLYMITVGDIQIRERFYHYAKQLHLRLANIIDKTAYVSPMSVIGEGNYIGKHAVIIAGSSLKDNNLVNSKALIEHGCIIGSNTNISTNAVLNGDIVVKDGAYIGSSSVCNGQILIGEYSVVGSGAVVIENVDSYSTVVGIPAKMIKRYGKSI